MRTVFLTLCLGAALSPLTGASSQDGVPLLLQARVLGDGQPVVLLGGGHLGADGWGGVPEALARTRRVINLQSLAVQYGLDGRDLPAEYRLETEAEALQRTLDTMGVADADVIGMSHGGVIALAFALGHPDRVRTLTLIEPPAFWLLPHHGYDDPGARAMQEFLAALRGRSINEEDVERFRCLLGDCAGGRSPRQSPQWPRWVKYRHSLRGLYTVKDYTGDPARLLALRMPALVVGGAQTVPFHRAMNEALLRALPRAEPLELAAGHNSPAAAPDHFVAAWLKFQERAVTASPR